METEAKQLGKLEVEGKLKDFHLPIGFYHIEFLNLRLFVILIFSYICIEAAAGSKKLEVLPFFYKKKS